MELNCYFFGTFNPIHNGHLLMAESVRCQFGFHRVIFIPAFNPPHRQDDPGMAPYAHRLKMAERACQDNPYFEVSDIESCRTAPSYTLETLRILIPEFDRLNIPVPVIIGTDALKDIASWYGAETLIRKVLFLQAPRLANPLQLETAIEGRKMLLSTKRIEMPLVDISSTLLRKRANGQKSLRYLTPDCVADYILWNNLYQEGV